MKIVHVISDGTDRERVERLICFLPQNFEHQLITANELAEATKDADVVHAHRWFGCGEAAWQRVAEQGTHVPYVMDIVQSDLAAYRKQPFFLHKRAHQVLESAERVIFTTPMQQDFLSEHLPAAIADHAFAQSSLLYETLPPFWLDNLRIHPPTALVHIKLLYVGAITADCRLDVLLQAVERIRRRNYEVSLTMAEDKVEEGGFRAKMLREVQKNSYLRFEEADTEGKRLELYRNHDMLVQTDAGVTSILRYAEALSQGLPLVYARGGIFDGVFKEGTAGYAVNPKSASELVEKILAISELFGTIEQHISRLHPLGLFDGREVAAHWGHLYENVAKLR